jgi:U6 snRNA phosphodiesterase
VLGKDEYLANLLSKALESAKEKVPSLYSIGLDDDSSWELHISLTRPTFLRTHQREDFKKAVKNTVKACSA